MILTAFAIILMGVIPYSHFIVGIWTKLNTYETQSSTSKQGKSPWKLETVRIDKDESIERLYFYDENVIYGIKYGKFEFTFYKTLNGGKSWESLSSITDFGINDIFFITPTEGFIVASKLKPSSMPSENGSYIMKTEDGGLSWKTVHSSVNTTFYKLNVNSDGFGVAIGRRETSAPQSDDTNLVLLTNDKGQTWSDVSEYLNQVAIKSKGRVEDLLTNVIFSQNKGIVVLSLRGKIYNSTDRGKSWSLISKLVNEPEQTGISHFGELENGKFWIAGGTMSVEGKWGVVAVMNNILGWNRYRLNNYYFSDVKFLSNNEVIAVGTAYASNNLGGNKDLNKGVILYSSDSGRNWIIVHESQSTGMFGKISKLSENKIFVVEKNGSGVFLERLSKNNGN